MFIIFVRWSLSVGMKRFTYLLTYLHNLSYFGVTCTSRLYPL